MTTTFEAGSWPTALPLVAILRGVEPHEAAAHAAALLEAGFDCIEVPTNSPDWADSVRTIGELAAGCALVGAGTVLAAAHLDALVAAGGRMAVSPHTDAALIEDAAGRGLFVLPGAMTASEVFAAHRAGAHAVKLFPAAQLGTGYVKALRAVLPHKLLLLAVGGVKPDNLADFLGAGCFGAGLGSDLYRPGQPARETAARARGVRRRVARGPIVLTVPLPRTARRMPTSTSSSMAQDAAALIALDWGSTSLRAFLMNATGTVLAERASDDGASRLAGGPAEFEQALRRLVGDWLQAHPRAPLLACGMVGSQHGWHEAPYAECPVAVDALDRHATVARGTKGLQVRIIPGVCLVAEPDVADVMRGEETQIAGLLGMHPDLAARCRAVLPGTHSKWVEVRDGCIVSFRTCMTGELFSVLREHSVLGRLMPPATDFHAGAFDEGLRRSRDEASLGLSWDLFSVRARALMRQLEAAALPDYLSGLLVGHEVAGALRAVPGDEPLALVGDPVLCHRYERALQLLGRPARVIASNTAPQGLWRLGVHALLT